MKRKSLTVILVWTLLTAWSCEKPSREVKAGTPPHPDTARELDVAAACVDNKIAVRNNSREVWTNVRIVIDEIEGESGFTHTIPQLKPREALDLSPDLFTHPTRKREKADQFVCRTLNIHADTPRGPAHWHREKDAPRP